MKKGYHKYREDQRNDRSEVLRSEGFVLFWRGLLD